MLIVRYVFVIKAPSGESIVFWKYIIYIRYTFHHTYSQCKKYNFLSSFDLSLELHTHTYNINAYNRCELHLIPKYKNQNLIIKWIPEASYEISNVLLTENTTNRLAGLLDIISYSRFQMLDKMETSKINQDTQMDPPREVKTGVSGKRLLLLLQR